MAGHTQVVGYVSEQTKAREGRHMGWVEIVRRCGSGGGGFVDIEGGVALLWWLGGSSCEFVQMG